MQRVRSRLERTMISSCSDAVTLLQKCFPRPRSFANDACTVGNLPSRVSTELLDPLAGFSGEPGKIADFLGHDGKAFAGFAGAGLFDAGVERERE
nr:hypothetical protein [Rhizobium bangladeshense]